MAFSYTLNLRTNYYSCTTKQVFLKLRTITIHVQPTRCSKIGASPNTCNWIVQISIIMLNVLEANVKRLKYYLSLINVFDGITFNFYKLNHHEEGKIVINKSIFIREIILYILLEMKSSARKRKLCTVA